MFIPGATLCGREGKDRKYTHANKQRRLCLDHDLGIKETQRCDDKVQSDSHQNLSRLLVKFLDIHLEDSKHQGLSNLPQFPFNRIKS